jgi:hypothetical protein
MRLLCERRNLSIENLAAEVVRKLTNNAGEPESKTTGAQQINFAEHFQVPARQLISQALWKGSVADIYFLSAGV